MKRPVEHREGLIGMCSNCAAVNVLRRRRIRLDLLDPDDPRDCDVVVLYGNRMTPWLHNRAVLETRYALRDACAMGWEA